MFYVGITKKKIKSDIYKYSLYQYLMQGTFSQNTCFYIGIRIWHVKGGSSAGAPGARPPV